MVGVSYCFLCPLAFSVGFSDIPGRAFQLFIIIFWDNSERLNFFGDEDD